MSETPPTLARFITRILSFISYSRHIEFAEIKVIMDLPYLRANGHSESMCGELMVYQIRLQSLTSLNVTGRLKMQGRKMMDQIAGVANDGPGK